MLRCPCSAFSSTNEPTSSTLNTFPSSPLEFGWRRSVVRTCLVALEMLVSLVLPDFQAILNLVGGSTIALMSFVMPPLCYLRLSAAKDPAGLPFRYVTVEKELGRG